MSRRLSHDSLFFAIVLAAGGVELFSTSVGGKLTAFVEVEKQNAKGFLQENRRREAEIWK